MTENIFEYIKILLPRHKCVTLPGLGAFILNKDEDNTFDAKMYMMPPSHSITFNSRLQHDDGTLSSYIQSMNGTSYDRANKELAGIVKMLRANLLLNKEILCGSLGKIELIDSTIVFSQNKDYISPIHFGLSPIGLSSITTINQGIEKETKTISLKKKLITASASAAAVLFLTLPSTTISDSMEQGGSQKAGYLSSLVASRNIPFVNEPKVEEAVIIEEIDADKVITKSTAEIVQANKIKSDRTYYLIVGGESSERLANRTLDRLKNEGFETAQVLESPQRYRIYTQTFESMNEAEKAVEQFRAQNPKYKAAWIHSRKN